MQKSVLVVLKCLLWLLPACAYVGVHKDTKTKNNLQAILTLNLMIHHFPLLKGMCC